MIDIEGQKFWVAPNGSKHMMELSSPIAALRQDILALPSFTATAEKTILAHEMILDDFYKALTMVIKRGNIYQTEGLLFNRWQIGIDPARTTNDLPAIIHALKIRG